jgi:hypothetical protein
MKKENIQIWMDASSQQRDWYGNGRVVMLVGMQQAKWEYRHKWCGNSLYNNCNAIMHFLLSLSFSSFSFSFFLSPYLPLSLSFCLPLPPPLFLSAKLVASERDYVTRWIFFLKAPKIK